MPRAVAYIRVSTDDQVESGAGLKAQLHACMGYAARERLELVGPFQEVDGLSGATPFELCPRLMDSVAELKRGDVLLVAKRDRLARDRVKIIMFEAVLKSRGCRLVSAAGEGTDADDPNDLSAFLLRGITDLFAEYERLVIKFRTASALQASRRAGDRVGRVPYGFDLVDDGRRSKNGLKDGAERPVKLAPNPTELDRLATMRACRERKWTYRAIAGHVNGLGWRTKAGKPWTHSAVHHVLTNLHPLIPRADIDHENQEASPGIDPQDAVRPAAGADGRQ